LRDWEVRKKGEREPKVEMEKKIDSLPVFFVQVFEGRLAFMGQQKVFSGSELEHGEVTI
jgi:hypothetical protein